MNSQSKYSCLRQILKDLQKVVVAYSGGVDSTFLLKVSVETLGAENVLACIGISPSLAESQYQQALKNAEIIGIYVHEIQLKEVLDSKYAANSRDRCFHCKSYLYSALREFSKAKGFNNVICGCNFEDLADFRPGNKAAEAFNVRSPLADAEMTKSDIRSFSRKFDLPTADLPASPCLASRVAYGLQITKQRLNQIEQAENFLKELGFAEFRVRHHDAVARIEVKPQDLARIIDQPCRLNIVEKMKSLGFKYVTLDLQGFRSGSLNEVLTNTQKRNSIH